MFLKPDYLINGDVTDIDLDLLYSHGIRGLIFDLDSTLMAPRTGTIGNEVAKWLEKAKDRFALAIVSNNKKEPYIENVRQLLNMPTVGKAAKPSIKAFLQVLEIMKLAAGEVAVIGDRPLTDVWGGQRAGMKTILVDPLKTMNEPSWIIYLRKIERLVVKN